MEHEPAWIHLYKPAEVDRILRWSQGRTSRLARQGRIRFVRLPDGQIRIPRATLEDLVRPIEPPEFPRCMTKPIGGIAGDPPSPGLGVADV